MKAVIGKFLTLLILPVSLSMNAVVFAQDKNDHESLAVTYENLAQEALGKIDQQREIVENRPRASYFGKGGNDIKKRVAFRVHKYEKTVSGYLAQAKYPEQIANMAN